MQIKLYRFNRFEIELQKYTWVIFPALIEFIFIYNYFKLHSNFFRKNCSAIQWDGNICHKNTFYEIFTCDNSNQP